MPFAESVIARFHSKYVRGADDECWLWTDAPAGNGYGMMSVGGRGGSKQYAHRLSYEIHVGPIPDGLTIDHVWKRGCRSRLCVNPNHLEPVTNGDNVRRADPGQRTRDRAAAQTHCKRNHPFDEANTYRDRGARACRACHALRERRRKERV